MDGKHIMNWDIKDVCSWLRSSSRFSQYEDIFRKNDMIGIDLYEVNQHGLQRFLGISPEDSIAMFREIQKMKKYIQYTPIQQIIRCPSYLIFIPFIEAAKVLDALEYGFIEDVDKDFVNDDYFQKYVKHTWIDICQQQLVLHRAILNASVSIRYAKEKNIFTFNMSHEDRILDADRNRKFANHIDIKRKSTRRSSI